MAGAPTGYDVFLSYSRADQAAANALRDRLAGDGKLRVFIDWRTLATGRPWQPALESALSGCRAMIVLIGPKGIGGWQHREIQLGLDRQTGAERTPTPFPVIPVLLPGLEPDDYPLGTFLALNTWVAFEQTVDEPAPLQRLLAGIHGQPIDGARDFASLRPYRGLLAFREQDAGLFFGRERFVEELVGKVRQRSAANVVAVLGRSGSGKSSVVFAGLFPALRQEKGVGQQSVWQILNLRPGTEPLHALIEAFDPPDEGLTRAKRLASIDADVELLRQRKVTLAQLVRDRLKDDPGTTRQLLYVDQWEELYTQAQPREPKTDEEKARAADARLFVDLALDAATKAPCTLVLSVRSDFYPDIQAHDRLRAAVQDCQVSLGPMTKAELTAAIEGPARKVDGSVQPDLTLRLLRDIGLDRGKGRADHDPGEARDHYYDIGKLPLLEYALEQAWAKAKDGRLGLAHYAGLEQALEERANTIYDRLPPDQQAAAKRLFVSLVTPGEGHEDTRARITLQADPTLERVASAFAASDARLIVTGDDGAGARAAEVSHEALIRHWKRLRAWIDENRANLRTRSALAAHRAEWLKQKQDRSLLVEPGLRLEAARRLRDQPGDVEIADLQDYLDASFRADARRKLRRKLGLAASAATAALMALLAAWGWYQYTESARRAAETTAALIWSRLDFEPTGDPRSAYAVQALWKLATDPPAVRDAFLSQLAPDRHLIDTLAAAPASIARAFGLRPTNAEMQRFLIPIFDAIRQTADPDQLRALTQAAQTLGPTPDAIRKITDPDLLHALTQAAQTLGPTPKRAQAALGPALEDIRQIYGEDYFAALVWAVQTGRPTRQQARRAIGPVLDAIRRTTDRDQLHALAQAVQILAPKLAPEQAQAALGPVLDDIRQTTHFYQLQALAQAVQTLGPKLAPEQTQAALGPLLDAIRQTINPDQLQALAQAVQTLAPKLAPKQAQVALGPLLDDIRQTTQPNQLQALAQAIQTLGPTPEQAQAAIGPVLGAIRQTTQPYQLQALIQAVHALGPKLAPEQTNSVIEIPRIVLASTDEPRVAEAFAYAIAVTLPLAPPRPQPYVAAIVELLKWPTTAYPGATEALLEVLHDRVPEAPGKEAGLDATVQWVAATYPEIDLDSPPTPPASASTGTAW